MKLLDKIKEKRKKRIEKDFTNYVEKLKKENKLNIKDLAMLNYKSEIAVGKMMCFALFCLFVALVAVF